MTDHYEDLTNTAAYLSEHAKSEFAKMPEKTIARCLNKHPPASARPSPCNTRGWSC